MSINLGLGEFGTAMGKASTEIVENIKTTFEMFIRGVVDWLDDLWYQITDITVKIVNIFEIFIICFFTWLSLYSILYPQDLWNKGMQTAALVSNGVGSFMGNSARIMI